MTAERLLSFAAIASLICAAGCAPGGVGGRDQPIYGPGTTGVVATGSNGSTSTIGGGSLGGGSGNIGAFSSGPDMNFVRQRHTATVFPPAGQWKQGGVLVVGGDDGAGNLFPDSEVFDPTANTWSLTSKLNAGGGLMKNSKVPNTPQTARRSHIAVTTSTGKVLVSGGFGVDGNAAGSPVLQTSYLFDPATNGFTQVDDCPSARFMHAGALLGNGKILVCTGLDSTGATSRSAETFDGQLHWHPVGGAAGQAVIDAHFGAVVVGQGNKALVASGANVLVKQGRLVLGTPPFPGVRVEVYDVAADKFGPGPTLNEDRVFFAGVTIAQGDSFLCGGLTLTPQGANSVLDTINRYDHQAGTFKPTGGMVSKHQNCLATEVDAGKTGNFVVTAGVDDNGTVINLAEVWQFQLNAVAKPQGQIKMKKARVLHAQSQILDGRMIVTGGQDPNGVVMKSTEIYKD